MPNNEKNKSIFSAAALLFLLLIACQRSKVDDELGHALRKSKQLILAFIFWAFIISGLFAAYTTLTTNEINLSLIGTIICAPFFYIILKWLFSGQTPKVFLTVLVFLLIIRLVILLFCGEPVSQFLNFG